MMSGYALSVVVPAYNEKDSLAELLRRIFLVVDPLQQPWELILVDDGSTDGSFETVRSLKHDYPMLRGLRFDANHGQTAALAAGIEAAQGKIVITLDADLQNDPTDIPRLLQALPGHAAAVGWRTVRRDSLVRRISSRIANAVRNVVSNEEIRDTGCSLKAFQKEVLARLPWFDGMHRFLPTLVKLAGGKVVEVPVGHLPRTRGVSKYSIWNRMFRSFLDLLVIRWMKSRRLRYRITDEV